MSVAIHELLCSQTPKATFVVRKPPLAISSKGEKARAHQKKLKAHFDEHEREMEQLRLKSLELHKALEV